MRLLLLEDELAIASALSRSMRKWGHEVTVANSCDEARKCAADKAPEALVSDLKLPDGAGLTIARELGVPFILMSGYAGFDEAVAALRLGCVDFLTKPVALADLKASLVRLQDRFGSWEMCVVEPTGTAGELSLSRPTADGIQTQVFSAQELRWNDREQGQACFAEVADATWTDTERVVVAELIQATVTGRLVINRGQTWWRARLEAELGDEVDGDRLQVIESHVQRLIRRADGMLVELAIGSAAEPVALTTVAEGAS